MLKVYLLLILFLLGGCVTFKESHLFKDNTPNLPNYYKLHINGWTFMGKAKYVSGYFDVEAVEEYFGEFGQPAKYSFIKNSNEAQSTTPEESEIIGSLENKKLVMILSSNSKAVSDQLGSIAENQQLNSAMQSIVNS